MTWESLAPWIAICFTLALSILVPLFTQIANNSHQRKMQREKMEYEQKQKKIIAYEDFLKNVGAATASHYAENLSLAGASIATLYLYVPIEWYDDLDSLHDHIRRGEWSNASEVFKRINRFISEDILSTKGGKS